MTHKAEIQSGFGNAKNELVELVRAMEVEAIEQRALDASIAYWAAQPPQGEDVHVDAPAHELTDLLRRIYMPDGTHNAFQFKGPFEELFDGYQPIRDEKVIDLGVFRKMLNL